MKVLGLCSYPIEAAATRFRMGQFVAPLLERGIELEVRPFLSSEQFRGLYGGSGLAGKALGMIKPVIGRIGDVKRVREYDLIFVEREAMLFGPAIFERLMQHFGKKPIVLDLDDATYIRYTSPRYGNIGSALKFFGKTDKLIERASLVICGNRFIAEYVEAKKTKAVVIPTVVDTDIFCPVEKHNDVPVVGWIGTHSTFPFLESIFPVLKKLAEKHRFILKVVGSGRDDVRLDGVEVINQKWDLEREVEDFRSIDVGLYPVTVSASANRDWILGKSGFKAIQYLAVGVPFVMSPVGVCAEIGEPGTTHFNAETDEDWYNFLNKLLSDPELRQRMGRNARQHSIDNYSLSKQAEKLAESFFSVGS